MLGFGGDVIAGVAEGRFDIGVSQSSEIVAHPGVVLAGRLPAPFDHRTRYVAAKAAGAGPGADAFLAVLQGARDARRSRLSGSLNHKQCGAPHQFGCGFELQHAPVALRLPLHRMRAFDAKRGEGGAYAA